VLIDRLYADRGYETSSIAAAPLERGITLVGTDHDVARGTITIAFRRFARLLADECFSDVLAELRHEGAVLCEFVKLAIDGVGRSRRVLASLFHTAFHLRPGDQGLRSGRRRGESAPRQLLQEDAWVFLPSPASDRTLASMPLRSLLSLDLSYAERRIGNVQGAARDGPGLDRSLYRDCFSHDEAVVITRRLRGPGGTAERARRARKTNLGQRTIRLQTAPKFRA
jgi:hypothetical protein